MHICHALSTLFPFSIYAFLVGDRLPDLTVENQNAAKSAAHAERGQAKSHSFHILAVPSLQTSL